MILVLVVTASAVGLRVLWRRAAVRWAALSEEERAAVLDEAQVW